ncbi:MAG: 2-succinyl-5-enolpyruvyl-6-hydroxy-3-cyclohexene-1-carboxylic-acid synthase, partial [Verrucomicrobia bacterium]|nr:2-succinyl-5-enolpyruvyl-6-hydroxy-3-cyclohexene-1-carboxylic-acid synthase [Verrucomicrobiota bacterium]
MKSRETARARAGAANVAFGETVVRSLLAFGVGHFLVSPGSRSTPLVLAIAKLAPSRRTVLLDERSAAFHALGRIKAGRRPVAVVCTSGTAAAEFYPAVIEAREAGLPLVVLTADRPPELRHCQAGQTIDQLKLYGTYPLFHAELPLPEPEPLLLRQTRELCRRAVESALQAVPGPVHLNCPFREPFFPPEEAAVMPTPAVEEAPVAWVRTVPPPARLPARTLLLAGPLPWDAGAEEAEALARFSTENGLPLLADAANPLRHAEEEIPYLISGYDAVARSEALRESLRPEALVVWGSFPTSKALRQWLAERDLPLWQAGPGVPGANPVHGQLQYAGNDPAAFLASASVVKSTYGSDWSPLEETFRRQRTEAFAANGPIFEGDVFRRLPDLLAPGTPVLFANSLAIRDAEWFLPANGRRLRP